ncbi:unnamed protein product [Adineta steineri]|uniref:Uncharacterized protein n=1 Tax=Adineta steineri TaxID=433720 RepID=A0A814NA02_9BILA|nr:unnamed protein product [Adineta steineri]
MATSRQNTYVRIPYPEGGTPNTGDLVELVFDKFSPRPHFIVRQTEGNVDKNTKANEIDETMLLVIKFLKNRPKYDQQAVRIIKFALRESLRGQYIIEYLDFEKQAL